MKNWQAAAATAVSVIALMGAIGFLAPGSRAEKIEKTAVEMKADLEKVKERVNASDVRMEGMSKDLGYIMDALDEMRGLPKRRRAR